ncbi:ABC transporter substrate-binding protein [Myroides sp. 1354]|uniref:heme/hemin ABC transporter substrate-binding protein n=1 Tax=unclassified Myroides TaxID=2642485 RepID=UPI0025773D6D|nr:MULTISPECIES: ABC transporter substrate-binding protein [unclassified Myroides]MDM1043613.1 ABC transporter substrate-binding protein [Myroides sp. R163-1]MDM1054337.1 ABC transporter substrate-binding protein [Myroides sp. 1354]MDM1067633.1 ABC transporter substrate-binding protein [Myroides sp. 1372]
MKRSALLVLLALSVVACKNSKEEKAVETTNTEVATSNERIVSLSGAITETLVDLGQRKNIVGIDITSTYPTDMNTTATQLEHVNKINIEALMALKPTLVYIAKKDLNDNLKKQLEDAKIKLVVIDQDFSIEGTKTLIKDIAASLNLTDYDGLLAKIDQDTAQLKTLENKPKVLFIYARGAANLFVAGDKTPMQNIIELAGGQNAVTGFDDFKPLTPEALLNSNPDYILMFDTGLQSMGGVDGVLKIEGLDRTNAGKNKKIIAMDGLLLTGFTPRVGAAVTQLNQQLSE